MVQCEDQVRNTVQKDRRVLYSIIPLAEHGDFKDGRKITK